MIKNKVIIIPWSKKICKGARTLAEATDIPCKGIKVLKYLEPADIYINWGYYGINFQVKGKIVNSVHSTGMSANKITTLAMLKNANVPVPWFTTSLHIAREYMQETGKTLLARTKIQGKQGKGIHFIDNVEKLIPAPLYVEFIDKIEEYRVHVWRYVAIDIVRKERPSDNSMIAWNFHNGCRFKHELDSKPSMVGQLAFLGTKAVRILGLDFGAVDIIQYNKTLYVLEVNTAVGIAIDKTIEAYADKIMELKNGK